MHVPVEARQRVGLESPFVRKSASQANHLGVNSRQPSDLAGRLDGVEKLVNGGGWLYGGADWSVVRAFQGLDPVPGSALVLSRGHRIFRATYS